MDDISRDPDAPQPARSGAARGAGRWAEDVGQAPGDVPEHAAGAHPAADCGADPRWEGRSATDLGPAGVAPGSDPGGEGDFAGDPQLEARFGRGVFGPAGRGAEAAEGGQASGATELGDEPPQNRLASVTRGEDPGLEVAAADEEAVVTPQDSANEGQGDGQPEKAPEGAPIQGASGEPEDRDPSDAEPAASQPGGSQPQAAESSPEGDAAGAEAEGQKVPSSSSGSDGLPEVPELTDPAEVAPLLMPLLLTARDGTSILRLAQACNSTPNTVKEALPILQQRLSQAGLPLEVVRAGEAAKLMAVPDVFPYLQRLRGVKQADKLSPAALETLAVVAYRQPVIRGEIESIRGVKCGPVLRMLLDHKLVAVVGRADVPGRPLQYGTTQHFLERFALESLKDLPSLREFRQLG